MGAPSTLTAGSDVVFRFDILNPASETGDLTAPQEGDPFDLTGAVLHFFIKRSLQDSDAAAEFVGTLGNGIELAFALIDGQVDVTVPALVTSDLRRGRTYPYYLRVSKSGELFQPFDGAFLVTL